MATPYHDDDRDDVYDVLNDSSCFVCHRCRCYPYLNACGGGDVCDGGSYSCENRGGGDDDYACDCAYHPLNQMIMPHDDYYYYDVYDVYLCLNAGASVNWFHLATCWVLFLDQNVTDDFHDVFCDECYPKQLMWVVPNLAN